MLLYIMIKVIVYTANLFAILKGLFVHRMTCLLVLQHSTYLMHLEMRLLARSYAPISGITFMISCSYVITQCIKALI